jgi:hypothetical protein
MKAYCTKGFFDEFSKLSKKKQYKDLESLILGFFLDNIFSVVATGDRLYGPNEIPFLKKRLPNSGGYRIYFLADFKNEKVYINYVHPKTGPDGIDNVTNSFKKELHTSILAERNNLKTLFEIEKCSERKGLLFSEIKQQVVKK